MTVEDAVAFPALMAGGVKDGLGEGDRADAREANDADAALLRHDGSGDRGDGFGLVDGLASGRTSQDDLRADEMRDIFASGKAALLADLI